MKDSFIFYRSFFECIKRQPLEKGYALFMAICEYACNGKELELTEEEEGIFILMKPQIDANNRKYENGKKGGRPKKETSKNKNQIETSSFEESNENKNQTETKLKPNVNVNDNVNNNVNDNTDSQCAHAKHTRFDEFWKVYPRKKDMLNAQGEYTYLLKTTPSLSEEDLLAAAQNYAEYCQIQNAKERYIKIPANWLRESSWIDYLPKNYKKPEVIKKSSSSFSAQKVNRNTFNNFQNRDYQFDDLESKLLAVQ